MWDNIKPGYAPFQNSKRAKIKRILRKIWRRFKIFIEHDDTRLLNQIDRYNIPSISIGDFTYGHPDSNSPEIIYFGEKSSLSIGKFCSIAEHVTIFIGGYHDSRNISTYPFAALYSDVEQINIMLDKEQTLIGNDVWIGRQAILMAGIKIGNGAIIAAGSVVTQNVNPYEIVGGNPARVIRKRFNENQITLLEEIKWWNWDIRKIKENVNYLNGGDIDIFLKTHLQK